MTSKLAAAVLGAGVSVVLGLAHPLPLRACGACGAGDSTLTSAGTEQPFAGRLRLALAVRYRTDNIGRAGVDQMAVREIRSDAWLSWAPRERLFLIANVPLVHRQIQDDNLAKSQIWGIGEVELGTKWFGLRERSFAPRWLIAWLTGVKLPTAPRRRAPGGEYLPLEAQPGSGSLDMSLGPAASVFLEPLSLYASLSWVEPLVTRSSSRPGRSLRPGLAVQYALGQVVTARVAADARWDGASEQSGRTEANSGGFIAFAGADLLVSPLMDTVVLFGARWPALDRLRGSHVEGPLFSLAFIRDW